MRKFKCYDCNHTWEIPFGQGGRGFEQSCPKCGSRNVHRINKRGGWAWRNHRTHTGSREEHVLES